MKARVPVLLAGLLALSLGATGLTRASTRQIVVPPTSPTAYNVTAGLGTAQSLTIFTPGWLDVYVGDTVTWHIGTSLDAHTVSFGPRPLLKRIADGGFRMVPQKQGPPQMVLSPQLIYPTRTTTYNGTGVVSSGVLVKGPRHPFTSGQSWSLTFTKPGTYRYYCLMHFPYMSGTIVVHPRPAPARLYHVQAGDSLQAHAADPSNDEIIGFFPRTLTIHVGDTVAWFGPGHTVTFGPQALRDDLTRNNVIQVPQQKGLPLVIFNPKAAYPSGGSTYDGTGFVSSGMMQFDPKKAPQAQEYRLTFTKPGVYRYSCLMHPGMTGTIHVLP